MLKFLITLGTGVYVGVYLSQNFEIPRVDEPAELWERIKKFADENKNNK
jgi:hypothetical protein